MVNNVSDARFGARSKPRVYRTVHIGRVTFAHTHPADDADNRRTVNEKGLSGRIGDFILDRESKYFMR